MSWKSRAAAIATFVFLAGGTAQADILFIDTNNQAIEKTTLDELGRQYGERVHVVKGDGPELEEIFRRANAGEINLRTIVGSGHSSGTGFSGQGGSLTSSIDDLLKKYPDAQNQVRHFIGLGCYTGTKYSQAEWQSRFPNATVLAGFNGLAPSGYWSAKFLKGVFNAIMAARRAAGATDDAFATRLGTNNAAVATLKQTLGALDSVRITVASFQICENFWDPKGRTREKVKAEIEAGLRVMQGYLNGWGHDDVPADPHAPSPLRTFYNDVQAYLGDASIEERAELIKAKDQTIRLIYFKNVKTNVVRSITDEEIAKANEAFVAAGTKYGWGDDAKPMRFPSRDALSKMTRKQIADLFSSMGYNLPTAPEPVAPVTPSADGTTTAPAATTPAGPTAAQVAATKALYEKLKKELVDLDVPFSYIDTPPVG